jgi:ubiquinone/menaquinone biosynthesis C-methylase UbiE
MLNGKDKEAIIRRYNSRIQELGAVESVLAIGPKHRRDLRYGIISEIGIMNGDSVLDIGCGFGGLHDYLVENEIQTEYVGMDINEAIINIAKSKKSSINFIVGEIDHIANDSFDYVVSSSSFNLKMNQHENYEFIRGILGEAFRVAKKGVAIDFLSSYAEYKSEDVFYYDPAIVFGLAKSLTKRVALRHDYELFDFTIYMYPDFSGWIYNESDE